MGAKRIMELMDGIPYLRRIGLSATPERQFDDVANKVLQRFLEQKTNILMNIQ